MSRVGLWAGLFGLVRCKKGFLEMEDLFSVLVYALIFFFFLVILSVPHCRGSTTLEGLEGTSEGIAKLNSEQELLEMLRTPLPDNLPAVIDGKKDEKVWESHDIYSGANYILAVGELSDNDKVYRGKTYGEFIDSLQHSVADVTTRNAVFAAVTRAVFLKSAYPPHVMELRPDTNNIMVYPEVYVKYGIVGTFEKESFADLSNRLPPLKHLPRRDVAIAFIPLTSDELAPEARVATIMMTIAQEGIE